MSDPPSPLRQTEDLIETTSSEEQVSSAVTAPTTTRTSGVYAPALFVPSFWDPATLGPSTNVPLDPQALAPLSNLPLQTQQLQQQDAARTLVAQPGPSFSTGASSSSPRAGRKAKAHVASACVNCKRAHLSCDVGRPCHRCIASGKQDSCVDVQHKKRGRPRLREEGEFRVEQMPPGNPVASFNTPSTSLESPARPIAATRTRRAYSSLSYQSQTSESSVGGGISNPTYPRQAASAASRVTFGYPEIPTSYPGVQPYEIPTAYLNLDLVVVRANQPWRQIMLGGQEVSGRALAELASPMDGVSFYDIRNLLRAERETRDPAYMPPITLPGQDIVQGLSETEVELYAQGFDDRSYTWAQTQTGPIGQNFPARVRLAKAGVYFVAVTLPSFRPMDYPTPQPPPPLFGRPTLPSGLQTHTPETFNSPDRPPTAMQPPRTAFYTYPGQPAPPIAQHQQPSSGARTYPPPQPGHPLPQPIQPSTYPPYPPPPIPRLPVAEPPTETTAFTPWMPAREQAPPARMQLPPIVGSPAPGGGGVIPMVAGPSEPRSAIAEAAAEGDDNEREGSPRKRRRTGMGIDDVLQ